MRHASPEVYGQNFRTALGFFCLSATKRGLYSLEFGKGVQSSTMRVPSRVKATLEQAQRKIQSHFQGEQVDFGKILIDWGTFTQFERRVLECLRKIPSGKTTSYQFLAARAGNSRAARYVGRILHLNRLPIVLPCHRILPKSGEVGGFSKGLGWKRRLLKLEGVDVDKMGRGKRPGLTVKKRVL